MNARVTGAVTLACVVVLFACRSEVDEPVETVDPEYEGVSLEEMERQAEPMSLEEAERLGIIDTTIRIEPPIHPDSIPDEGGPEPLAPTEP